MRALGGRPGGIGSVPLAADGLRRRRGANIVESQRSQPSVQRPAPASPLDAGARRGLGRTTATRPLRAPRRRRDDRFEAEGVASARLGNQGKQASPRGWAGLPVLVRGSSDLRPKRGISDVRFAGNGSFPRIIGVFRASRAEPLKQLTSSSLGDELDRVVRCASQPAARVAPANSRAGTARGASTPPAPCLRSQRSTLGGPA
jgi:hypothetical protein